MTNPREGHPQGKAFAIVNGGTRVKTAYTTIIQGPKVAKENRNAKVIVGLIF